MSFAYLQPVANVPVEVVAKTGMNLLEYGVLGTLLVLSVLINVLVIRKLVKVQDQRVEDQKSISAVAEKMTTAFTTVSNHLDRMIESDRNQTGAMGDLKKSLDSVVTQAISGLTRSPSNPPSRSGSGR